MTDQLAIMLAPNLIEPQKRMSLGRDFNFSHPFCSERY
jgi:hypothetical protein